MSENHEFLLELYQKMVRIRLFEASVVSIFAEGSIPGFVHSYIGSSPKYLKYLQVNQIHFLHDFCILSSPLGVITHPPLILNRGSTWRISLYFAVSV